MVKRVCELTSPRDDKQVLAIISILLISNLLVQDFAYASSEFSNLETEHTWREAVELCESSNSTLAMFNTSDISSTKSLGEGSYWSGRYKIQSPWIDITGCYALNNKLLRNKITTKASLCFVYCQNHTHFGLQEGGCFCLNENPGPAAYVSNNSCIPSSNNNYIVGRNGFMAVYKIYDGHPTIDQSTVQRTDPLICAFASCEGMLWRYFVGGCDGSYYALCEDGRISDITDWLDASTNCNNIGSYLAGANRITEHCKSHSGGFWTHFHRELVKIDINFSDKFRNADPIFCEYISIPSHGNFSIGFDSCTRKRKAICVKENHRNTASTVMSTRSDDRITKSYTTLPTSMVDESTPVYSSNESSSSSTLPQRQEASETHESHQIIYIAVGCSVGALLISVILIIVFCKIRRPRSKSSRYNNQAKSKLSHINNNNHKKDRTKFTSSNTHQHENNYTLPSYKFVKPPYEVINIVDPKVDLGSRNHEAGNDSRATKPNAYSEPLSNDKGHVFQHKMVDNETTLPKNNIPNNQYSLVSKRGDDNHKIKEDHEIEFKKDDYDQINNVNIEYKKKHSIKDETNDKGPINRTTDEDDYDQFERNNVNKSGPTLNYDHVAMHRKCSNTKDNFEGEDDLEDYDHLQKSPKRPESVDSTYDHTHTMKFEDTYNHFNPKHPCANPDTYGHRPNEDEDDDYATADNQDEDKISGDYEISDELPAVRVNSGNRDSYYTSLTLPEMDA